MLLFTVAFVDFNWNNAAYFKYEYNYFRWLLLVLKNELCPVCFYVNKEAFEDFRYKISTPLKACYMSQPKVITHTLFDLQNTYEKYKISYSCILLENIHSSVF